MRKISLWLFILVFTASFAHAQDAAMQQQVDQLNGKIQDLLEAQAAQTKRLDALEKEIGELRDKVSQPAAVNDSASTEDLKKLAAQVQEIDRKRVADNEQIIKVISKLGSTVRRTPPTAPISNDTPPLAPGTKQKGYDYEIHSGDTVSGIAKAYRAQGVKVTSEQILAANPGLNPSSLIVGKKIFIPDAAAK